MKQAFKILLVVGALVVLAGCGSDETSLAETSPQVEDETSPTETSAQVEAVRPASDDDQNTQLLYHDSYWVTQVEVDNALDVTVINDMYVDLDTMRVTVYAQSRILASRLIVSPPQVDPGECEDTLVGDRVCHHPNAVYLNGSGQELETSDGTGEWWVKHSWILGGEGYFNCPLPPQEFYDDCFWVEGEVAEDGVSIQVGGVEPGDEDYFNIRGPDLDSSPIQYDLARFEPAEDGSGPVETFTLTWQCEEAVSAFDGSDRTCRDS